MIRLHVGDEQVIQFPTAQRIGDIFKENLINCLIAGVEQNCFFIEQEIRVITDAVRDTVNALKEGKAAVIGTDPDQVVLNFTCAMHGSSFPSAEERTVQLSILLYHRSERQSTSRFGMWLYQKSGCILSDAAPVPACFFGHFHVL